MEIKQLKKQIEEYKKKIEDLEEKLDEIEENKKNKEKHNKNRDALEGLRKYINELLKKEDLSDMHITYDASGDPFEAMCNFHDFKEYQYMAKEIFIKINYIEEIN
jgi:DNA repair exonuclease SbcCD ATPase subunit